MVRNLHLFILLCGVLIALQGCINPLNIEEPEPEKGQFKIVLTSDLGQTKAFWEVDPEKRNLGEPCERELHSVTILVYDVTKGEPNLPYPRPFTPAELKRGSSIFSLPLNIPVPGAGEKLEIAFHAFANYKVKTNVTEPNLYGDALGSISEYLNPTGSSPLDINFSSIYPDGPAAPAVALRDVASGKGFVMTSLPVIIQMSPDDDPNTPRTVNLKLARAVSRIEINAHTTSAFTDKYPGSTLVINSLSMSYMPTASVLCIFPEGKNPPTVRDFVTMRQQPNITMVDGLTHHNFIFYCYENTQQLKTPPLQQPRLDIMATFDFDGDPLTKNDITIVKYSKKLTMSNGNGSIFRNTLYQVEIMLNGLSEREVISSIEILPWSTVYEEVNFGG